MTTELTQIFKSELLQSFADELKENGFKIYYSPYDDGRKTTYFYFVEGDNIGYCQENYFGGLSFSTVHKPCRECGTGYGLNEDGIYEPTIKDARKAFINYPNWATAKDRQAVKKYKNWEDYQTIAVNRILKYVQY